MEPLSVISCVRYRNGKLERDGVQLSVSDATAEEALANTYRTIAPDHPRFFKMDAPSKLAFIASEALLAPLAGRIEGSRDRIGIVHMSRHACLGTDVRYWDQLREENLASPALFVYTLPNIPVGEISIRHRFHGPSLCLLGGRPDAALLRLTCARMIADEGMDLVLCGWSDIFADRAEAVFLLAATAGGSAWNDQLFEPIPDDEHH